MSQCWSVLQCSLDTGDFGWIDRCYCQLVFVLFERMADVIANLVFVADVLATVFMSGGIDMRQDVMAMVCVTDFVVTYVFIYLVTGVVATFDVKFCLADVIANVGNTSTVARALAHG